MRVGESFGLWTVLSEQAVPEKKKKYLCRCKCGNEREVRADHLTGGRSTSCGCEKQGTTTNFPLRHERNSWESMNRRCYDPKCSSYKWYGAKGIGVCERWRNSFENFIEDMGPRPSPTHSLDRIKVRKDYGPGNCRWASKEEQANNNSRNRFITYEGRKQTIAQWAKEFDMRYSLLLGRLNSGWSFAEAIAV